MAKLSTILGFCEKSIKSAKQFSNQLWKSSFSFWKSQYIYIYICSWRLYWTIRFFERLRNFDVKLWIEFWSFFCFIGILGKKNGENTRPRIAVKIFDRNSNRNRNSKSNLCLMSATKEKLSVFLVNFSGL